MTEGIPFGPYRLLRRLARGGMAEIFLARKDGPEGFSRSLVVKRILPHLVRDRSFVQMFLAEARIAALLAHPNVVHVYDFGEVDGSFYLAMEHVRGVDLRAVLDRATELGPRMPAVPLAHAVKIVSFVCEGLAHAHALREGGQPLGLVHRDVTPSNVLLSFDGAVKVADFGIAKVRLAALGEETRIGVVKGKIAYMSPEQARGEPLDRRSDLFNAGLLLYECFAGRPLLSPQAVERARRQPDEPRAMLPALPPMPGAPEALVAIVRRATEPEPAARYADALSMRSDLEELSRELPETSGTVEIGAYVRQLVGVDASDAEAVELGLRVEPVGSRTESRVGGTRPVGGARAGLATATAAVARGAVTQTAAGAGDGPTRTAVGPDVPGASQRAAAARAVALPGRATTGGRRLDGGVAEAATAALPWAEEPPTALVPLERPLPVGDGPTLEATIVEPQPGPRSDRVAPRLWLAGAGAGLVLAVLAALGTMLALGRETGLPAPAAGPETRPAPAPRRLAAAPMLPAAPPAEPIAPVRPASPPARATLAIESTPAGAQTSIDGEPRGTTPLVVDDAAVGWHEVLVTLAGHASSRVEVTLGAGERRTVQVMLAPEAAPAPTAVAGEPVASRTPASSERAPARTERGARERREPAARDPRPTADERPSGTGTLTLVTIPWSEVYLGRRRLGQVPLRVRLPAGRHSLTLRSQGRPDRHTTVVIEPDHETRVRLTL